METIGVAVSVECEVCSSDSEQSVNNDIEARDPATDGAVSPLMQHDHQKKIPDCGCGSRSLIPVQCSNETFRLSDAISVLSAEEISQRREALKLFSSQVSMASCTHKGSCNQLPGVTVSYELTPFSSTISSLCPICRICQCPGDAKNVLISPCRCSGSLKFIHGTCLRVSMNLC